MKIKKIVDKTFWLYLLVGVLNFIVCTAIMFILFNLCGVSEHLAPVVNYVLGSIIWYFSCQYLLFRGRASTWQTIVRFIIEVLVCYGFSYYAVAPLCSRGLLKLQGVRSFFSFGGEDKMAGNCEMTIGALVYAIVNYFGQRYFVFSPALTSTRRQKKKNRKSKAPSF